MVLIGSSRLDFRKRRLKPALQHSYKTTAMKKLEKIDGQFAVCKIAQTPAVPDWAHGEFVQLSYSENECTVVCEQENVPVDIVCEKDWICFRIAGELQFDQIGIIADVSRVLAEAKISVFAVSTFDTDYFLVKSDKLKDAINCLISNGYDWA